MNNKVFISVFLLIVVPILCMACNKGTTDSTDENVDPDEEFVAETYSPYVFSKGESGYNTFRIPAIVKTTKGTILAFCEGRKESSSDTGDINLILRRSIDEGKSWSPIIVAWDDGYNTCGNPAPVVDPVTGRIHLLMTWNLGTDGQSASDFNNGLTTDTRRVYYTYSDDDGITWADAKEITSQAKYDGYGWYATGPCHGIVLQNGEHAGRIVIPCDCTKIGGSGYSHVIYSDDNGENWNIGGMVTNGNESSVAELEDGRIIITCRRSGGYRYLAWSEDGGETFGTSVKETSLPDPACQGSILSTYYNGDCVLLHSNCSDSSSRVKLTLKASLDGGESWNSGYTVWSGMAAYSDLIIIKDNIIGVLYENGDSNRYERISFDRVSMNNVINN